MNYNKAIILGRVTADPDVKQLPSGVVVAKFSLATNHVYKDKDGEKVEDVTFHNLVAFSRLAEIVGDYVTKGSLLLAEGRLQTSSWDDKKTGEKKYRTEIIVENVQLAPKSTNAPSSNGSYDRKERAKKTSSADEEYDNFDKPTRSKKPKVDEGEVNPEDIPF